MKLAFKTKYPRSTHPNSSCNIEEPDFVYETPRKGSAPVQSASKLHYAKRETAPELRKVTDLQTPQLQKNQFSFKASTQDVFDSRKAKQIIQYRQEWKILTLQQIKANRNSNLADNRDDYSRKSSGKKIFLSISKSNRSSVSASKKLLEPRLMEVGGPHKTLQIMARGRIVQKVEIQLEESHFFDRLC